MVVQKPTISILELFEPEASIFYKWHDTQLKDGTHNRERKNFPPNSIEDFIQFVHRVRLLRRCFLTAVKETSIVYASRKNVQRG